jgi:hypothetical protein
MVLVATLAKQQALMKKAKQTHKQNRSRTYVHVRAWICIAIGHPRPMAIIHLSLSLSAPAAATNRQGYPGSKAGFVYWTNHHHMANVVARGVSSYMYVWP